MSALYWWNNTMKYVTELILQQILCRLKFNIFLAAILCRQVPIIIEMNINCRIPMY